MRGMTYPELVNAFKTCDLLPTVEAGEEVDLEEHGILMDGSVTAWVEKPNLGLTRRGNVSKLQRASVAMRPPQHSQQQGDTPQGEHKTISAPALLKPGTYPVETSATVRSASGAARCIASTRAARVSMHRFCVGPLGTQCGAMPQKHERG